MDFTIDTGESLEMSLSTDDGLSFNLSGNDGIEFTITTPTSIDVEQYEGPYTITPRLDEQTLETARKLAREDITVHKIPITYTSNLFGGQTVLIG